MIANEKAARIIVIMLVISMLTLASGCCGPASPASPKPDAGNEKKVVFTDSNGNEVSLPDVAKRILVTNSDCAEMLIAIGARDRIVGVVESVKKNPVVSPQLASDIPSVGDWKTPNIEKMLTIKPDVVICYSSSSKPTNADQIEAAGISIVYLDCYKLPTLAADARALGIITSNTREANTYAQFIEGHLKNVSDRVSSIPADKKPSVYWEGYTAYTSAGKGSGGDSLVEMAGGNNLASFNNSASVKVSPEWVLTSRPSVIFKVVNFTFVTEEDMRKAMDEIKSREGMWGVDAVRGDDVYVISGGIAFGPKSVVGLVYAAKAMHPGLFADVDAVAIQDEYMKRFMKGSVNATFFFPVPG